LIFAGQQQPDLPAEISTALQTLVQYGFTPSQTIAAVREIGLYWADRLASRAAMSPVRLMGLSIDFDEFCNPIIDALGRYDRAVATHCLWIAETPYDRSVGFEGLIASEYRHKQSLICDEVIIATAVMTERNQLNIMLDRAREMYDPSDIRVIAAVASDELVAQSTDGLRVEALLRLPKHSSKFNPNMFGLFRQRLPAANVRPNHMPKTIMKAAFKGPQIGM